MGLDDPKFLKRYDSSGMLEVIESFPEQCERAKEIGVRFDPPPGLKAGYANVAFTGVGGSAIGAEVLRSYLSGEVDIPIVVNRNYTLPGFVGRGSLVVVTSYSGNTEETISAYRDALSKRAKVVAVTSGGRLKDLAAKDGVPVLVIPPGLAPRCALGYSFFPLLLLMIKLGFVKNKARDIDGTIKWLDRLKDEDLGSSVPEAKNIAKRLAKSLYLKYPFIYGTQDHLYAAALRWRGQLAENSKMLSSTNVLPEMNHNEIIGWKRAGKLFKDFMVVLLRDSGESSRVSKRIDVTARMIKGHGVKVAEIHSMGDNPLARIFSLIYIGDFVSYYLSVLNKVDPTPVDDIAYLKEAMSKA